MMPRTCVCCGGDEHGDLLRLEPIEPEGAPPSDEALQLCTECLETRSSHSWGLGDSRLDILRDALADRESMHEGRFTYLATEADTIHLVRLQPSWVQEQTA